MFPFYRAEYAERQRIATMLLMKHCLTLQKMELNYAGANKLFSSFDLRDSVALTLFLILIFIIKIRIR